MRVQVLMLDENRVEYVVINNILEKIKEESIKVI